jgi:hypothetical protein
LGDIKNKEGTEVMNELRDRYSKLNNNELLVMVYFENSDYTSEAIDVAKKVLDERGLSQPSDEILQLAKDYQTQLKESEENIRDIFGEKKLKQAFKKRDYFFIGKWLFWSIAGYGIYSALISVKELVAKRPLWPGWILFILEVAFTIALFGIIPIIFFFIYSLKLPPRERKEKGLTLFMPKYVFFIYGVSLFLFVVLVILPRL